MYDIHQLNLMAEVISENQEIESAKVSTPTSNSGQMRDGLCLERNMQGPPRVERALKERQRLPSDMQQLRETLFLPHMELLVFGSLYGVALDMVIPAFIRDLRVPLYYLLHH